MKDKNKYYLINNETGEELEFDTKEKLDRVAKKLCPQYKKSSLVDNFFYCDNAVE